MDTKELKKLLVFLRQEYALFAPQIKAENLIIDRVDLLSAIDWSGEMPDNTWKEVFIPSTESLLPAGPSAEKVACIGVNVLDLKALTLVDYVFSRDKNYQNRRPGIFIVGYSAGLPSDYKKFKVFSHDYEENVLEHLIFDIFIIRTRGNKFKFYAGSDKGIKVLEAIGIKDGIYVKFAGPIPESGQDKTMLALKKKVESSFDKKVWNDLNKICIACGRCAVACPTCFCFNVVDKLDPNNSGRKRQWTTCFYSDFSRLAGGIEPLDTVKRKIYFWYAHKFVRIPHEFGLSGCVSCGRCTKVCPVGIKIQKVLKQL